MVRGLLVVGITVLLCMLRPCLAYGSPTFMGLGDLPGGSYFSSASGISPDGRYVVGISQSAASAGASYPYEAFFWSESTGMMGLGDLPGGEFSGIALDVSTSGVAVGYSATSTGDEPFRWSVADGMIGLGGLPGGPSPRGGASDITADGKTIVGGSAWGPSYQAFRWHESTGMTGLGYLPDGTTSFARTISDDGSTIAGECETPAGRRFFRWTTTDGLTGLGDPPAGYSGGAVFNVSANGRVVVGTLYRDTIDQDAFAWTPENGFAILGDLPGGARSASAYAVSEKGDVIIGRATSAQGTTSFFWNPTHGMRDLRDALVSDFGLDLADWPALYQPWDITPDGTTLIGWGTHTGFGAEAWIARIPEPSTWLFLALGAAFIIGRQRTASLH